MSDAVLVALTRPSAPRIRMVTVACSRQVTPMFVLVVVTITDVPCGYDWRSVFRVTRAASGEHGGGAAATGVPVAVGTLIGAGVGATVGGAVGAGGGVAGVVVGPVVDVCSPCGDAGGVEEVGGLNEPSSNVAPAAAANAATTATARPWPVSPVRTVWGISRV